MTNFFFFKSIYTHLHHPQRSKKDGRNGIFSFSQEFKSGTVRNFVMSVESPLGSLLYLRVWHDNSGIKDKASWYLNMINVMDLQTGEKYVLNHYVI